MTSAAKDTPPQASRPDCGQVFSCYTIFSTKKVLCRQEARMKQLVELRQSEDEPLRRPGRPRKSQQPMSGTERSMRRMGRMAGVELAAEDTIEQLWRLHRELVRAGLTQWAERVAQILKTGALKAAAEYARRNSAYFVRSGLSGLSSEETAQKREAIALLAYEIDLLVQDVLVGRGDYSEFDRILERLRDLGFWIDSALVSAVARAFTLA